jgi:hypothetical protein
MEGHVMTIRGELNPGSRNGMPASGMYVYRGRKREGLPDLETANAEIMKARRPGPWYDARPAGGPPPRRFTVPDGCCRNGHPWRKETTGIRSDGTRRCLTCRREANARRKETRAA